MKNTCPDCHRSFRKPSRPADATGAAAYLQYCPHCWRELVYGSGIKVRVALIALIAVAYWAGLFDLGSPVVNTGLRILAGVALIAVWLLMPNFVAGPRRYNVETGMAEEVAGTTE